MRYNKAIRVVSSTSRRAKKMTVITVINRKANRYFQSCAAKDGFCIWVEFIIPFQLIGMLSCSGINPYIGIAAAQYQLHRVAQARGRSDGEVQTFVNQYTKGRQFGFLGNLR